MHAHYVNRDLVLRGYTDEFLSNPPGDTGGFSYRGVRDWRITCKATTEEQMTLPPTAICSLSYLINFSTAY